MKNVEIIVDFGKETIRRNGLPKGIIVAPCQEGEMPGQVWVPCPPVCTKRPDGFFMISAGYVLLEPHEYEFTEKEITTDHV